MDVVGIVAVFFLLLIVGFVLKGIYGGGARGRHGDETGAGPWYDGGDLSTTHSEGGSD